MKTAIILYFAISISCLPVTLVVIRNRKSFSLNLMRALLLVSMFTTLAYYISLISPSQTIVKTAFSVYVGSMNFLTLTLALYLHSEAGRIHRFEKRFHFYYLVAVADFLQIMLNLKFGHVMEFQFYQGVFANIIAFTPKPMYYVHLLICYLPLVPAVLDTIEKAYKTPRFYRREYLTSLTVIGFLLAVNTIYLCTRLQYDFTVGLYGISAMILLYFSLVITPNKLKEKLSELLIANNEVATILFDIHGKQIIYNEKYSKWANHLDIDYDRIKNFFSDAEKTGEDTFEKNLILTVDGEEKTFICQTSSLTYLDHNNKKVKLGDMVTALDITEKVKEQMKNQKKLRYDDMTGLYNFSYFAIVGEKMMKDHPEKEYLFLVNDIKQFKLFNGLMGIEAGNEVIRRVGDILRGNIPSDDVIYCRIDNDKFGILGEKSILLPRIEDGCMGTKPFTYNGYKLSCLMGIYEVTDHAEPLKAMYQKALLAIEDLKKKGNAATQFYNQNIYEEKFREQDIISCFKDAIRSGEFVVYIQPQYAVTDSQLIGGEALVRWIKNGKMIAPGAFIPILERNGAILELDKYVWEETCKFIRNVKQAGVDISLSVNVSAQDIFLMDTFAYFSALVQKYEISPSQLRIEITESHIVEDIAFYIQLIGRFNRAGFTVEMDDFGSGYSSLNTLKDVPVNVLKMDMKFLSSSNEERARAIIELIIMLSKRLRIPVIAEGVETPAQLEYLREIGCDYIQGYLMGRPMPQNEFVKLVHA